MEALLPSFSCVSDTCRREGCLLPEENVTPTQYYESAVASFEPCFSRKATYCWFAVMMIGLLVRTDHWGVSSFVRGLALSASSYEGLLNFLHSSAWTLEGILFHWWAWLGCHAQFVEVNGRRALVGDHIKVAKDARKMPAVVTLHQDSETQSKPSFFRGHNWAFVAGLVSQRQVPFATPLWGRLDQGLDACGEQTDPELTMPRRMVRMALQFATRTDHPCYLVLDAFFAVGSTFLEAQTVYPLALREQLVHILTRAKDNAVAFLDPEEPPPGRKGRKPFYGKKLRLRELFVDRADDFVSAEAQVYGHKETISYLCLDLLWAPVKCKLRFVLAVTSLGQIVLMGSDLNLDPLEMVRLYCLRSRIETMFRVLKHILGGMAYHFWCKCLERQSRRPKKNADSPSPSSEQQAKAQRTRKAIEGFVNFVAICQGLLQLTALKFHADLWHTSHVWLRTYSSQIPSEYVTKTILARTFLAHLLNFKRSAILDTIRSKQPAPHETQRFRPPDPPGTSH